MTISQKELREILHYDRETGEFTWKKRLSNRTNIGDIAGSIDKDGYLCIQINGQKYFAHRLAWFYVHGYFPENGLDHIDRVKSNNLIANLREASQSCNMRNVGHRIDNTSGVKGISFDYRRGKWRANIKVNNKQIYLGIFTNKLEAAKARHRAEIEHNFPNCNTDSTAMKYIMEKIDD